MKTGRNPAMRHLTRARRVPVAWLLEQHVRENFELVYATTDGVAADVFAASTLAPIEWAESRKLISVFGTSDGMYDATRRDRPPSVTLAFARLCCCFLLYFL